MRRAAALRRTAARQDGGRWSSWVWDEVRRYCTHVRARHGGYICGCPDLGTCLRARPGMAWRKGAMGTRPPGFPPGPLRGLTAYVGPAPRPPPGGRNHSPATPLRAKRQAVLNPGRRTAIVYRNAHPWIDPRWAVDQSSPAVNPARGGSIQRLDQSPDAHIIINLSPNTVTQSAWFSQNFRSRKQGTKASRSICTSRRICLAIRASALRSPKRRQKLSMQPKMRLLPKV